MLASLFRPRSFIHSLYTVNALDLGNISSVCHLELSKQTKNNEPGKFEKLRKVKNSYSWTLGCDCWVYVCFQGQHWTLIYVSTCSASECDFADGSCGWYELTLGDGFDWVRGSSAEVPPEYYGNPPPLDHTTNSTQGKETTSMQLPASINRWHKNRNAMNWYNDFPVSKVRNWQIILLSADQIKVLWEERKSLFLCFWKISTSWRNAFSAIWIIERKSTYAVPILHINTTSFTEIHNTMLTLTHH